MRPTPRFSADLGRPETVPVGGEAMMHPESLAALGGVRCPHPCDGHRTRFVSPRYQGFSPLASTTAAAIRDSLVRTCPALNLNAGPSALPLESLYV